MALFLLIVMIITAIVVGHILRAVVARIDEENDKRKIYGKEESDEED
jgi:hypothetical protein